MKLFRLLAVIFSSFFSIGLQAQECKPSENEETMSIVAQEENSDLIDEDEDQEEEEE